MAGTSRSPSAMVLTGVLAVLAVGFVSFLAETRAGDEAAPADPAALVTELDHQVVGQVVPRPRPCKPCKDRPWCECTYKGAPRISCDPCCYDTQPYPTCLD